jgi:hypothetical protein
VALETEQAQVEQWDARRAPAHAAERQNAATQMTWPASRKSWKACGGGLRKTGLVELTRRHHHRADALPSTGGGAADVVESLPDLEEQLNRKRGQLRRMGLINLTPSASTWK